MKKYLKPVAEMVELELEDVVSASSEEASENPNYAVNYSPAGPGIGLPGHGGSGNVGATCCN